MAFRPHGALEVLRSSMAMLAALVLAWQAIPSEACRCMAREYCEITSEVDVLVSGTILKRKSKGRKSTSSIRDVVYTLSVTGAYKTDTSLTCGQNVDFYTADNSAACGLYLEIGEEYVVGMNSLDDGSLHANSCGPTRAVDSLSEEMLEVLENGGDCPSP